MRLDEEKLEALRSWGERLRQSGGEESAAVGRGILMLVEEIDRLHIELWHARMQSSRREEPIATAETPEVDEEPVASTLHAGVQRVLRPDDADEPPEPSAAETESDRMTSPQAWLAALRRQK
jgi:hypothetical protein